MSEVEGGLPEVSADGEDSNSESADRDGDDDCELRLHLDDASAGESEDDSEKHVETSATEYNGNEVQQQTVEQQVVESEEKLSTDETQEQNPETSQESGFDQPIDQQTASDLGHENIDATSMESQNGGTDPPVVTEQSEYGLASTLNLGGGDTYHQQLSSPAAVTTEELLEVDPSISDLVRTVAGESQGNDGQQAVAAPGCSEEDDNHNTVTDPETAELLSALDLASQETDEHDQANQHSAPGSCARLHDDEEMAESTATRMLQEALDEETSYCSPNPLAGKSAISTDRMASRSPSLNCPTPSSLTSNEPRSPSSQQRRSQRNADLALREEAERIRQETLRQEQEFLRIRRQAERLEKGDENDDENEEEHEEPMDHDDRDAEQLQQIEQDPSTVDTAAAEEPEPSIEPEPEVERELTEEEKQGMRLCEVRLKPLSRHDFLLWTGKEDPSVWVPGKKLSEVGALVKPLKEAVKKVNTPGTPSERRQSSEVKPVSTVVSCFNCRQKLVINQKKPTAYCSEKCIIAQVVKAKKVLMDPAEHVIMVEEGTGKVVGAPTAPKLAVLSDWLFKNPTFCPLLPDSHHKDSPSTSDAGDSTSRDVPDSPSVARRSANDEGVPEAIRMNVKKVIKDLLTSRVKRGDAGDLPVNPSDIRSISVQLEENVHRESRSLQRYKRWFKKLFEILKSPNHASGGFFRRIVSNELTPVKLATYDAELLLELSRTNPTFGVETLVNQAVLSFGPSTPKVRSKPAKFILKPNPHTEAAALRIDEKKTPRKSSVNHPKQTETPKPAPEVLDITAQHGSHLFDKRCNICSGQITLEQYEMEKRARKREEQARKRAAEKEKAAEKAKAESASEQMAEAADENVRPTDPSESLPPLRPETESTATDSVPLPGNNVPDGGDYDNDYGGIEHDDDDEAGGIVQPAVDEPLTRATTPPPPPPPRPVPPPESVPLPVSSPSNLKNVDTNNVRSNDRPQAHVAPIIRASSKQTYDDTVPSPDPNESPDYEGPDETKNWWDECDSHIWTGEIRMPSFYSFTTQMHIVSGESTLKLRDTLPSTLEIVGRIPHQNLWTYFKQIRVASVTQIVLLRLDIPEDLTDRAQFDGLFENMKNKRKFSVIGRIKHKLIKDFYLIPLEVNEPPNKTLQPIMGPGIPAGCGRQFLVCIVLRAPPPAHEALIISRFHNQSRPAPSPAKPMDKQKSILKSVDKAGTETHKSTPIIPASPPDESQDMDVVEHSDDEDADKSKFSSFVHKDAMASYRLTPEPSSEGGNTPYQPAISPTQLNVSEYRERQLYDQQKSQMRNIIYAPLGGSLLAPPPPPPPPEPEEEAACSSLLPPPPKAPVLMKDVQRCIDLIKSHPDVTALVTEVQQFMEDNPLSNAECAELAEALRVRLSEETERTQREELEPPEPEPVEEDYSSRPGLSQMFAGGDEYDEPDNYPPRNHRFNAPPPQRVGDRPGLSDALLNFYSSEPGTSQQDDDGYDGGQKSEYDCSLSGDAKRRRLELQRHRQNWESRYGGDEPVHEEHHFEPEPDMIPPLVPRGRGRGTARRSRGRPPYDEENNGYGDSDHDNQHEYEDQHERGGWRGGRGGRGRGFGRQGAHDEPGFGGRGRRSGGLMGDMPPPTDAYIPPDYPNPKFAGPRQERAPPREPPPFEAGPPPGYNAGPDHRFNVPSEEPDQEQSDFNGPPEESDGPANQFDGPPYEHNEQPTDFHGPPHANFDGPPPGFNGPRPRFDGPRGPFNGPRHRFDGPRPRFDIPPHGFDGPPGGFDGPPGGFDGPPGGFHGPPGGFDGPARPRFRGPRPRFDGPGGFGPRFRPPFDGPFRGPRPSFRPPF